MLKHLLQRLSEGRSLSLVDLARELEVSETLVEMMIADLVRSGYLRPAQDCAEGSCQGCGAARLCIRSEVKLWVSTGKAF